jgi:hypothetical protein
MQYDSADGAGRPPDARAAAEKLLERLRAMNERRPAGELQHAIRTLEQWLAKYYGRNSE